MTKRAAQLPPDVRCYRVVGPFDEASLPEGLRNEHRLKPDVWGLVSLSDGRVSFVWDDDKGGETLLTAPATFAVPPEVPHHLRIDCPFRLTIGFHRAG